jgi:ribosomal protein S18 acetylase RimI-like enzyme
MSEHTIAIEDNPSPEDVRRLWDGLYEYNFSQTGLEGQLISVFLRNDQHQVVGGARGWTAFGWLHIDVFWLREDERHRGWGTRILRAMEAEAMRRGCRQAKVDTFSFQALGFYQKNGYQVFGELDKVAGDHKWYFLRKDLS